MHPLDYNLQLATSMLEEMEDYLLASEVFWPLGRRSHSSRLPFPRLTIGGLLLTVDELSVQEESMTTAQRAQFNRLKLQINSIRQKWTVAIEQKAAKELRNRLNLWRAYLSDIKERSDTPENYAYEVRQRVMFDRLIDFANIRETIQSQWEEMQVLDNHLQAIFVGGDFIWDPRLQDIYPQPQFWYLYGKPRQPE